MPFGSNDTSALLADFGVSCSKGATNFTGILDVPGEVLDVGGIAVQTHAYRLTYPTSAVSLHRGDSIVADGRSFTVRADALELDDGLFSAVDLTA